MLPEGESHFIAPAIISPAFFDNEGDTGSTPLNMTRSAEKEGI
jgi:hypothetical protein